MGGPAPLGVISWTKRVWLDLRVGGGWISWGWSSFSSLHVEMAVTSLPSRGTTLWMPTPGDTQGLQH